MARGERPLDEGDGPLLGMAADLRALREKAGSPAYRELSRRAHFSTGALSDAAGGRRLPSLPVTLAYVEACGGDVVEWEHRWHEVAAELRGAEEVAAEPDGRAPYLGLTAFGADDGDRFFGRDRLVAELSAAVADHRFVVVTGPSGAGKSSVLRAGLVPAAAGPVVVLTPGPHPLQELAAHLSRLVDGDVGALHTAVGTDPDALHLTALRALVDRPAGVDVLLVVDQFEEVFTLVRDAGERDRFLAALFAAARAANSRTRVVVGVRADFYAHCARHPDLVEVLGSAQVLVGPMTTDELRAAVTRPAVGAGYQVESALVTRVIADATGEPGVLPLVSHALLETWRRRRGVTLTAVGYEAVGGVGHALARTAEAVHAELSEPQRARARLLFLRLVELGEGTEDTRRSLDRAELDLDDPDTAVVLERLVAARLVTLDRDRAQLGHEALIRNWGRLRDWLAEDREGLRLHRRLTEATGAWESLDRDPGALYRGNRLARARDLDDLTARERAFVDAGTAAEATERLVDRRRARRLRVLVAVLVVLLVATTATTLLAVRARTELTAQRNAALARTVTAEAVAMRATDPALAGRLALAAYRLQPAPDTRDGLVSAMAATLTGHTDAVNGATFTPDGRTLVTAGRDGTVRLWDVATRTQTASASNGGRIAAVAVSPDGRSLATAGYDKTVRFWNVDDPLHPDESAVLTGHTDAVYSVAFSPDGRTVATGSYDHTIGLWDVATKQRITTLTGHTSNVKPVAFSPDGRFLASGGDDMTVRLWSVADPAHAEQVEVFAGHSNYVVSLAFSPDSRTLASGGDDTTVRLWDITASGPPKILKGHTDVVSALAFSRDGHTLASGSYDHTIRLWDKASGTSTNTLTGHTGAVESLAFNSAGTLASASDDHTAQLWDTDVPRVEAMTCAQPGSALTPDSWSHHFPDLDYHDPC